MAIEFRGITADLAKLLLSVPRDSVCEETFRQRGVYSRSSTPYRIHGW